MDLEEGVAALFGSSFRSLFRLCSDFERCKVVLLAGLSGSGKTSLVYETAKVLGVSVQPVGGMIEVTSKKKESIGFYDDTEHWIGSNDKGRDEVQTARLLGILKAIWKQNFSTLIVTCISKNNIPKGILSRFDEVINLDFPDILHRETIINHYISQYTLDQFKQQENEQNILQSKLCKLAAANTFGFLPCDLQSLSEYIIRQLHENQNNWKAISEQLFVAPGKFVRCSALPSFTVDPIPSVQWEDVGGLESVKRELRENIVWVYRHKEAFKRLGIDPVKGIMLYGPPGTGKTLLAKAIATEVNANFINTRISSILNAYVGESERILSDIFERAKNAAPSVIFFDEIDALFGERDSDASQNCQMMISQLLLELDKITTSHPIMVIAATNCPEVIDESFIQPGRFDQLIYVGPPDYWGRKGILDIFLSSMKTSSQINLDSILTQTEGFTGADLRSLCNLAGQSAIARNLEAENIIQQDFQFALQNMIPSVSADLLMKYKQWKK